MANLITEKKYRFELSENKKKERLDVYLTNSLENATRSRVQKLIEAGYVLVNSKKGKSNYIVHPNDIIEVNIPVSPRPEKTEPEEIPIDIIFEDEYLMLINKPPGMVVHPSYANWSGTLVNALLFHSKSLSSVNEAGRPGIVHRIDKDTSGLLVIAKDDWTHAQLAAQFAKHSIEREYWAVSWGLFKEKKGEISSNIMRSKSDRKKFAHSSTEGKTALTYYEVIEEFEFTTLLKLKLKTGRTHQIRVHLASLRHPIFGDTTYGGNVIIYGSSLPGMKNRVENLLKIMPRQALHAKTLGFIHPHSKDFMKFETNLPKDMIELIQKLKNS
jgi:23S rRNA pseudouridine1911/1915/1917 synthase